MRRFVVQNSRIVLLYTALLFVPTAEAVLRLMNVGRPIFVQADPELGAAYIPDSSGWFIEEGGAFVRINSHGMRDVDRAVAKPANTFRVAVLGDSFTAALQVAQDRTFCAQIEKELAARGGCGGLKTEVLNFGCGGYSLVQQYLRYQKQVHQFEPDVVVLAITTGTNIAWNSRELSTTKMRPFFVLRGDTMEIDTSFKNDGSYKIRDTGLTRTFTALARHSKLMQVVNRIRVNLRESLRADHGSAEGGEKTAPDGNLVYKESSDRSWNDAWQITECGLVLFNDEVQRNGSKFMTVILSNAVQVNPEARIRNQLTQQLQVNDLFYPDRRLASFLEAKNIPVLPLAPTLLKYSEEHHINLHGFREMGSLGSGHWNEIGHEIAGRTIAAWIYNHCCSATSER